MSGGALFAAGLFVTLIVAASIVPLLWAAVMDGREEEAHATTETEGSGLDTVGADGLSGVPAL